MATRQSSRSPGVYTRRRPNWSWKLDTPKSVPAGARISAGKFGRVARSLPAHADSVVNCSPVSCMPSPESPANRITARSSALRDFSTPVAGVAIWPISSCLLARLAQSYPASLAREIRYRGCPPLASGHAPADHWSFYRTRTARATFHVRFSWTELSGAPSAGVDVVRALEDVARSQVQNRLGEEPREPADDVADRHDADRQDFPVDQRDR